MEILIFAALAAYLFFRLWSVLGTQNEKGDFLNRSTPIKGEVGDNVILLPQKQPKKSPFPELHQLSSEVQQELKKLSDLDSSFNLTSFLKGARAAFGMTIEAFSDGDLISLQKLLAPHVYNQFYSVIESRSAKKLTVKTEIKDITISDLTKIEIKEGEAFISLRFVSNQIVTTLNEEGQIIDNPSKLAVLMTDLWTFRREISATTPNWQLTETRSEK